MQAFFRQRFRRVSPARRGFEREYAMKRTVGFILVFMILLGTVPARADSDIFDAPSVSRFCSAAPMSENRAVFASAERTGFTPPLTRAMAAEILYAIDPLPDLHPMSRTFSDVNADSVYAAAASWAVEKGLFDSGDGSFSPDQALNREQLAILLNRYLACSDMVLPEINETVVFFDTPNLSPEGKTAAGVLQRGGVMAEASDGNFYPGAAVTLAQAETIFLRFIGAMRRRFMTLPTATVAESDPVDPSWFSDACFIGHSQVVAMRMYFDFTGTDYLAEVGFTAPDMLVHKGFHTSSGRAGSLLRLLQNKSYGKVFVMLGINDVSDRKNRIAEFKEPMRKILDMIKEMQPDAKLYLISLAPVGHAAPYVVIYNPRVTMLYSQAVKDLSREYGAEYIDLYRPLSGADGYMYDEYSVNDGIHITPETYSSLLEDYFRTHT